MVIIGVPHRHAYSVGCSLPRSKYSLNISRRQGDTMLASSSPLELTSRPLISQPLELPSIAFYASVSWLSENRVEFVAV